MRGEEGFTLIEIVCALAILAIVAALALTAYPRGTTPQRLSGYALEIAAILKSDRNAAVREGAPVSTSFDGRQRSVRSGASGARVDLPDDVGFDALLAQRCGERRTGSTIDFFPSGASCGGVVAISRGDVGYEIRVNWLTGGVEVVATGKS